MSRIRVGYAGYNHSLKANSGNFLSFNTIPHPWEIEARFRTNLENLTRIIGWNIVHKVHVFRINGGLIPARRVTPELCDKFLTKYDVEFSQLREMLHQSDQRVSFHMLYSSMGSFIPSGAANSLNEALSYDIILTRLGADDGVIILHCGKFNANRNAHEQRLIERISALPDRVRERILLENDTRWDPEMTWEVARQAGCGFCYDIFHHKLFDEFFQFTDENIQTALQRCATYCKRVKKTPKVHVSSQDPLGDAGKHADHVEWRDYVKLRKNMFALGIERMDIMLEAKKTDQALLTLRERVKQQESARFVVSTDGVLA